MANGTEVPTRRIDQEPSQGDGLSRSVLHLGEQVHSELSLQHLTVHNWVEAVYKAFDAPFPTSSRELAILGIRELKLKKSADPIAEQSVPEPAASQDKKAVPGKPSPKKPKPVPPETAITNLEEEAAKDLRNSTVVYESQERQADMSKYKTTYDDLLFCVWTDSSLESSQCVEVFQCSIDAGEADTTAPGLPILCEGQLYSAKPGSHKPGKYPGSDIALHLYTDTYKQIRLARSEVVTSRTFNSLESAYVQAAGKQSGEFDFCRIETNQTTIHVHFSGTGEFVKNWSVGCTVLRHARSSARYGEFMKIFNNASNKAEIPYLVVSSQYVKSYDKWVVDLEGKPLPPSKGSVILSEGLIKNPVFLIQNILDQGTDVIEDLFSNSPSEEYASGHYLPSFVTKSFANDAIALAADLLAMANALETHSPDTAAIGERLAQKYTPNKIKQLFKVPAQKTAAKSQSERLRRHADALLASLRSCGFLLNA